MVLSAELDGDPARQRFCESASTRVCARQQLPSTICSTRSIPPSRRCSRSGHASGRSAFLGSSTATWPSTSTSSAAAPLAVPLPPATQPGRLSRAHKSCGKLAGYSVRYDPLGETSTVRVRVRTNYYQLLAWAQKMCPNEVRLQKFFFTSFFESFSRVRFFASLDRLWPPSGRQWVPKVSILGAKRCPKSVNKRIFGKTRES